MVTSTLFDELTALVYRLPLLAFSCPSLREGGRIPIQKL